jgi:hypothetical protein
MNFHAYVVCAAGDKWNITLNGDVIGTFARRPEAVLAAVICARASRQIGQEAEVLMRGTSGRTHAVRTRNHLGVGLDQESP